MPVHVRDSSSTTTMRVGQRPRTSRSRQWRSTSAAVTAEGSPSTTAATTSPHSSSASPKTNTSRTPGSVAITFSTSAGLTFSPPLTIIASARPSIHTSPPGPMRPVSRVSNQPFGSVGSGSGAMPGPRTTAAARVGPRTRSTPPDPRRTSTPGSGCPALPGWRRARPGGAVATWDAVSVIPPGGRDRQSRRPGLVQERPRRCGAAHEHAAQGGRDALARQPGEDLPQHDRHDREVGHPARQDRPRDGAGVERGPEAHRGPPQHRPHNQGQTADVSQRQAQAPAVAGGESHSRSATAEAEAARVARVKPKARGAPEEPEVRMNVTTPGNAA